MIIKRLYQSVSALTLASFKNVCIVFMTTFLMHNTHYASTITVETQNIPVLTSLGMGQLILGKTTLLCQTNMNIVNNLSIVDDFVINTRGHDIILSASAGGITHKDSAQLTFTGGGSVTIPNYGNLDFVNATGGTTVNYGGNNNP